MEVHFRNSHGTRLWVAIMRHDPRGCGQYGNWATAGWWEVAHGQVTHAFNTSNRYFGYYVEAEDGAVWNGGFGPMDVYRAAFDSCIGIGSTAAYATVGLRRGDGGDNDRYTVNLL